ncbi:hypothetical protein [Tumebacillus permanentifrigoris]|uniref:Uncharacterized protein n=1 Tax=Tumebacillus permanentifrigoris TaxID=378543 RepID=A0A316D8A6_9BACL|nr:hypothetical protein [Tumebacillus permanentifrigoris]PWK13079.1 hypothetical protein C7459_10898 [Tumebacillus permanentifrigoris]
MKKATAILFGASICIGVFGYYSMSSNTAITTTSAPVPEVQTSQPNTIVVKGVIAAKSKTELVGESDVIIHGKVKELLPSAWSNPNGERGQDVRNVIQTDVVVHVGKTFKGEPYAKDIAVRIEKGKVGNTTWVSEGYPDFTPGEEVVLFLCQDHRDVAVPQESYYVLTGMLQGKFAHDPKHPEDKQLHNEKEAIDPTQLADEIATEEEAYKKLPKPAKPQGNI